MLSGPSPLDIRLCEYESIKTSDLTRDQAEALSQQFGSYIDVRPDWEPGRYELTAKQYVGTIVLGDVRIFIQPKVPVENLFYMLTYAYRLPEFRREEAGLGVSEDLFEFIVRIFVRQVEALVRRGIYRSYISYDENQPFLRGRLLMADHLRRNAVQVQRLYQRINEYTADILENQILKFTLWQLSWRDYRQPELRQDLRRTLSAFSEVSLAPVVSSMCDQVIYTRLNSAYRIPIHLARLLLQHLSPEVRPGETPFMAYLFDMNKVFEQFVARFLQEYFATDPMFQVKTQDPIPLDDEHKETGIPDIVLRKNGLPYLVLDTKYKVFKGKPEEADRNQMFMYCHALGLAQGILIYANDRPISYQGHFPQVTIRALALSLSGSLAEFRERCRKFADDLKALAQEPVIGMSTHASP